MASFITLFIINVLLFINVSSFNWLIILYTGTFLLPPPCPPTLALVCGPALVFFSAAARWGPWRGGRSQSWDRPLLLYSSWQGLCSRSLRAGAHARARDYLVRARCGTPDLATSCAGVPPACGSVARLGAIKGRLCLSIH